MSSGCEFIGLFLSCRSLYVSFCRSTPVKVDNPFEAKPKLARHNSLSKPKTYSELAAEKIPAVTPLSQVSKQPETSKSELVFCDVYITGLDLICKSSL